MNRRFAAAAFFVALVSCSDSGPSASGTISFTYVIGGTTLTFTASGSETFSESNKPFVAGTLAEAPSDGSLAIALRPVNDTASDIVVISTEHHAVGNTAINEVVCDTLSCAGFAALFADGNICGLTSGSVNVTQASANRLAGTFSGDGMCSTDFTDSTSFSITNGTFNVKMIDQTGLGLAPNPGALRRLDPAALRRRALLPIRP